MGESIVEADESTDDVVRTFGLYVHVCHDTIHEAVMIDVGFSGIVRDESSDDVLVTIYIDIDILHDTVLVEPEYEVLRTVHGLNGSVDPLEFGHQCCICETVSVYGTDRTTYLVIRTDHIDEGVDGPYIVHLGVDLMSDHDTCDRIVAIDRDT